MNLPRSYLAFHFLLLLLGIACATARVSMAEWNAFKQKYGKLYDYNDNMRHYGIYKWRALKVQEHNRRFAAGEVGYEMGLNEFSDTIQNVIAFRSNGAEPEADAPTQNRTIPSNYKYYDQITDGKDWRESGCISPVGNQGTECLACWAFAASGAIEAHLALKNHRLVELSPKHLLDCTNGYSAKCEGGWVSVAFNYTIENGIATKESYPFVPLSEECRYDRTTSAGRVRGYVTLNNADERELAEVVYNIGPVAVSIDHLHQSFQNYKRGVLKDEKCRSDRGSLRHAMLVVGFGTDAEWGDYWLIKNSYGTSWGIDGYLKLARNAGNMCGVASIPQYPLV
ncbi:cathepsin L1 [Drosophila miranda]|uniref:cathepsin L1 n=1 Tax=Drosophila miranda TaxID=7229 RepID=UPI0007E5ED46|nr:cathepsin L1 [Drosophila miranda]